MLSPHERWELEKPAGQGPSVYEDLLSLRYPAYKDRIVKARAAGYTDDEILPRLQEREAKALLYYPADQVNERIGRTPETINSVELYERRHLRDAYVKAYEGKLTEQEVDERLVAAELINVQAPLLLRDGELYKKLAGHIKMREGWVESAWNGAVRDRLNKDESSLGMRLIYGEESEGIWKQLDELDGLQQQYMPAKDPSFSGSVKRGVGGAIEVLAQYVKGAYRGATTYGPAMAAAGASTAAIMNTPAFSNPITAPAAGASVISGGVTGFGLGVAMGAGMENFEREAGGAMVEYCRMKDEQGRPMDRNAARVAAVLTGAVNAGLEHFQLSTFLENIPGGDRLVQFFSKAGMKKLLAIPTVRGALAEIGKKYIGGIATESIQEMAQETMTILGGELGKILSGQEFAGLDLEESIDRVLETGAQTVGTMAVSFLPGAAMNTVGGVRQARAIQKGAEQTAASLGISADELMARVNATDESAQGRAVDGLGENAQPSGPAMKDGVQLGPTREAAAKLEAQAQGQAVDGLGENGAEEDTNVYLPAQVLESYNQENPGLLEDLGIVVEPVEGTSEVRLTAEQYEALEDAAPDLAEAVKNDVRRGSKGLTTREVGETLKKKAEKPAWRTAEVDGITKDLEQKALGAGLDKAEARQWSKMAGAFVGVTSKRYNVAPSELANMKLVRGAEEVQGENFGQPVNAGVDLGQKVLILDLSGKIPDAQRATPQELLDFLKAEFVGKEPSISADGEAMIGLPSNSAAKHVVRSSWKGLTYEDMDTRTAGLMSLRDVLQNATLIESHLNRKPIKKEVKGIHRFYVPVWTHEGLKTLRIVAHERQKSDGKVPIDVSLYDVIVEGGNNENSPRLSGSTLSSAPPARQLGGAFHASIYDSQNGVKQKESPAVSHGLLAKEVVPSPGAPFELTIADMLRGVKDAEGRPYVGEEYRQSSVRQSEGYDPGDPKTWPEGPGRDEALALEAWQNLENDDEIETWPESPEKARALELQNESRQIDAWIENLSREEFDRRLRDDDPEFVWKNERGVELEKELRSLRRDLRKKKPKGAEGRLLQLIEAEEEAAAREAETYYQSAYHGSPHRFEKFELNSIGQGVGTQWQGWGLYFASRKDIANWYRTHKLSARSGDISFRKPLLLGGKKPSEINWAAVIPGVNTSYVQSFVERVLDAAQAWILRRRDEEARVWKRRSLSWIDFQHEIPQMIDLAVYSAQIYDDPPSLVEKLKDFITQNIDIPVIGGDKKGGQLYKVDIPDSDTLLDWDKRLSDQPEKVKKSIQSISNELGIEFNENWTGGELYKRIAVSKGSSLESFNHRNQKNDVNKDTSLLFYKHGVLGTQYLDERNEQQPNNDTHNFVIWDEDAISIEETYYQQRGPLTFKLTGKPVSGEYMAALEKLEAGEPVAAEEYNAIPEIQDARSRTATGSTLNATDREGIRKQVYDKLMSYGSAVTEVVDGQKRTVYNGEVRNDHRADIIIGLPASGKSSALVDPISSKYKSMIVDSDEAKKLIPEFDDGFGAGYVHEESKAVVSRVYEDATDEGRNVVIPIVGSNYTKLEKDYIDLLRQKGYKVYVHMADINPNVAAGRNLRRFAETGRFVDLEATSFKYGNKPREVFERIKKEGVADGYSRIDTTVFPGRQVEGTEDISHDRGDLRERRGGVPQGAHEVQSRESSQAGAAGGRRAAAGLGAERAGGTSREGTAPRGVSGRGGDINARLTVQSDGVSLIEFFESANRSTSFHELAHHMFRMIYALSGRDGVDPQLAEDVDTILREAGVTREEFDADTDGARTKAHEFFARGFEVYISEGKAPSKGLRGVFRRLRAWMIEVYRDVVQALGIELSDEMRGVYDRLLAMPEEIDAETTIQELAVEEAALKEEIQRHEQEARERANAVKTAYREGVKVGREAEAEKLTEFKEKAAERLAESKDRAAEKLGRVKEEAAGKLDELEVKRRLQLGSERAKAQMRITALKQKLQERQALKKEVNKLVKGINNMAKSESISWARHKELQKLLADYDLKKRRQETLDRRAELEEYLKENPEAADTMNAADLKHLGTRTLNDMTLDDLRTLNGQVQQIYDRGKEEYKVWDLERTERRDTIHSELVAVLKKRKTNLPKIVTKAEDIKKQYKGVRGKLEKAKDWTYAATLGPDRFFDWLDKGATDYTGAFVRHLVDEVDKQRDAALRHIFERRKWMEDRLKPLGFRMSDFTRIAATVEGKDFTWDDIMEIYIGMRNDKKGRAILYGNLKNVSDPEGTAAYLIGLLSEDHKKAAELVVEDHNRNVDRIEAGLIHAFQKGMDRETDYTSMRRLESLSPMGLIDAESAEALTDGMADAGVLRRVEDGFMKKRVEIKDENQTSIGLGLFSNWHEDVSRHEHSAAMASTARDLAGALLMRNPVDGQTIGKMVKERFGDEAWRTLVDFVNTNVTDDARLAHNLLDGMCNTMAKNMAIAYLAGNLGTVLKQTTSIPRFLITAGPHRILVSIAQFLTQGAKFLEKVYELDPQMRDRAGSPILTMLRQDPRWGRRMYQRGLDWLLGPISIMDRWVAAIGWKATYDANLRRLGHEGAVWEAQRAVRLTQQPASAKDAARMWRQNGFVRLSMIFTSDAAQTFGMTAYDLVQQLRSGKLVRAFSTLTALALTGILMKAASEGLPSDEDDEDEDRSWVLEAFTEQFISSIPLVGKEAMVLYDNMSGKRRGTQYSAFMTPIEKAARAWRLWTDEDSDEEDFRRATWLALEAFSLSGAAPLPVTGMRRIVQSMELAEEDGMAAALNLVGIRRRE